MENEKQKIINDLYTIRGGLSLISQNVDIIKENEKNSKNALEIIDGKKAKILAADNDFKEYNAKRIKKERELKVTEETTKEEIRETCRVKAVNETNDKADKARKYMPHFIDCDPEWISWWLIPIGVITLIMFFVAVGMKQWFLFVAAVAPVILYSLVILFLRIIDYNKAKKECVASEKLIKDMLSPSAIEKETDRLFVLAWERHLQQIETLRDEVERNKLRMVEWKERCDKINELSNTDIKQKQNFIRELKNNVKIINNQSRAIKNTLVAEYSTMLAESDWGNIDLLIYYLETGRADTIKEALLLLDKQCQTDEIVSSVRNASMTISNTIHSSMSQLGEALSKSFTLLGSKIDSQSTANALAMESMSKEISSKLTAQIDATRINNALLEKANRRSKELVDDMNYNNEFWQSRYWIDKHEN